MQIAKYMRKHKEFKNALQDPQKPLLRGQRSNMSYHSLFNNPERVIRMDIKSESQLRNQPSKEMINDDITTAFGIDPIEPQISVPPGTNVIAPSPGSITPKQKSLAVVGALAEDKVKLKLKI